MIRVIRPREARDLNLPGRKSLQIVSAEIGAAAVTLRLVEIPVADPGAAPREPHRHAAFEECMYVLSGQGATRTSTGETEVAAVPEFGPDKKSLPLDGMIQRKTSWARVLGHLRSLEPGPPGLGQR